MSAPHWVGVVEDGVVIESGYCYCRDDYGAEHDPGAGMPR